MLAVTLNNLAELGVKPHYLAWEKYLTRKLNLYSLICIPCCTVAMVIYALMGDFNYFPIFGISFSFMVLTVIFNVYLNYAYALYTAFGMAVYTIFAFSLQMGAQSFMYLFFFPLCITFLTLLNPVQKNIHVLVIRSLLFVFIVVYLSCLKFNWFPPKLEGSELSLVRMINFFFSTVLTLLLTISLARQNALQETELLTLVKEKEVLLAEVHHRVKNNMSIIISLLNLRKETCNSDEARNVLDDCKNRIYSMALIHKNLYGSKPAKHIPMQEYITELGEELVSAYAHSQKVTLLVNAHGCQFHLDNAIPSGFIINELITNSLKYALVKGRDLEINITLRKMGNSMHLLYFDNGPGFDSDKLNNSQSLGMTLIELLCQQMEARFDFKNDPGLVFNMDFPVAEHK